MMAVVEVEMLRCCIAMLDVDDVFEIWFRKESECESGGKGRWRI